MRRAAVALGLVALAAGCTRPGAGAHGGATPEEAARCALAAADAQSVDALVDCYHPLLRDEMRAEFREEEQAAAFWQEVADKLAPLEARLPDGFAFGPVPAGQERFGDRTATLRYSDRGKLELVRYEGRWYVGDLD